MPPKWINFLRDFFYGNALPPPAIRTCNALTAFFVAKLACVSKLDISSSVLQQNIKDLTPKRFITSPRVSDGWISPWSWVFTWNSHCFGVSTSWWRLNTSVNVSLSGSDSINFLSFSKCEHFWNCIETTLAVCGALVAMLLLCQCVKRAYTPKLADRFKRAADSVFITFLIRKS